MGARFARQLPVSACAVAAVLLLAVSLTVCVREASSATGNRAEGSSSPAAHRARSPKIRIKPAPQPDAVFEVTGLSPERRAALNKVDWKRDRWEMVFAVYAGAQEIGDRPAMLGTYEVEDDVLRFTPRFPLQAGVTYQAVFLAARIDDADAPVEKRVIGTFTIPENPPDEPTVVKQVYPSGKVLPENNLKFYLHFSAPMSQGEAYRHIHLYKKSGGEVDYPFLKLGQELWDDSGMRLTVFIDPGRIKRGLKPREEAGPVLEEGHTYTLTIDGDWPDAAGYPLEESFRKTFRAGPPDETQPNPETWKLTAPAAGTRRPLKVDFGEPLDHAMLGRVLQVVDSDGEAPAGQIEITDHERRWRFRPERPWRAGRYELVAETTLEDRAGNSIGRPFEVDVLKPIERRIKRETVSVPFDVQGE